MVDILDGIRRRHWIKLPLLWKNPDLNSIDWMKVMPSNVVQSALGTKVSNLSEIELGMVLKY
jgi:hypothetical protein